MSFTTVEIQVPEGMEEYVVMKDADDTAVLQRNALLLYPYIQNKNISHGRAAEILGIHKLDLIDLYGKMGFCYFDQTMEQLEEDLQTFKELGLDRVKV